METITTQLNQYYLAYDNTSLIEATSTHKLYSSSAVIPNVEGLKSFKVFVEKIPNTAYTKEQISDYIKANYSYHGIYNQNGIAKILDYNLDNISSNYYLVYTDYSALTLDHIIDSIDSEQQAIEYFRAICYSLFCLNSTYTSISESDVFCFNSEPMGDYKFPHSLVLKNIVQLHSLSSSTNKVSLAYDLGRILYRMFTKKCYKADSALPTEFIGATGITTLSLLSQNLLALCLNREQDMTHTIEKIIKHVKPDEIYTKFELLALNEETTSSAFKLEPIKEPLIFGIMYEKVIYLTNGAQIKLEDVQSLIIIDNQLPGNQDKVRCKLAHNDDTMITKCILHRSDFSVIAKNVMKI